MFEPTTQFQSITKGESFITIDGLHTGSPNSYIFRNILISGGYTKFDGEKIKGEFCYDAYLKEFKESKNLKYTIYCYCYDLRKIMEDPELFEFVFEVQMETERGIIGIETVQWNFIHPIDAKENLYYFESKIQKIWKELGGKNFPC